MPSPIPSPPPPEFHAACKRWASNNATSYDIAVLTSLTTSTPLPPSYSPTTVGFSATTRLPPPESLHLFHAAKDSARAAHHAATTAHNTTKILQSLSAPLPSTHVPFPSTLAAAPAKEALARAAYAAIGEICVISWRCPLPQLVAAGERFVYALRKCNWVAEVDEEERIVVWSPRENVSDLEMVTLALKVERVREKGVVPAGQIACIEKRRKRNVVAGRIGKWVLRGVVRVSRLCVWI